MSHPVVARRRLLAPSRTLVTQFVLVVLLASAAFLAFARESRACSPPPPGSVELPTPVSLRGSYVFAGKIVAAFSAPDGKREIYEFRVYAVWKGPLYETVFLDRPVGVVNENTSCAEVIKPLKTGRHYLVFASLTSVGSREVDLLENASKTIAELGEGRLSKPGASAPVPLVISEARAIAERTARTRVVIGSIAVLSVTATGVLILLSHVFLRRRYSTVVEVIRSLARRRPGGD